MLIRSCKHDNHEGENREDRESYYSYCHDGEVEVDLKKDEGNKSPEGDESQGKVVPGLNTSDWFAGGLDLSAGHRLISTFLIERDDIVVSGLHKKHHSRLPLFHIALP